MLKRNKRYFGKRSSFMLGPSAWRVQKQNCSGGFAARWES
jgi:hypothetical protein